MKAKTAVLAIGMRGAGKTTYCKKVKEAHPEINFFCRDDFFMEHFGHYSFDPYSGEGHYADFCFWQHIEESLRERSGVFLIDYWTGWADVRRKIVAKLCGYGATGVFGLYFDTPLETCVKQFVLRETKVDDLDWQKEMYEHMARHNYDLFHKNLSDIFPTEEEKSWLVPNAELDPNFVCDRLKFHFDGLTIVNPSQLTLPGVF